MESPIGCVEWTLPAGAADALLTPKSVTWNSLICSISRLLARSMSPSWTRLCVHPQVLALIAVEHGDLAEVKRVEYVHRQAHHEEGARRDYRSFEGTRMLHVSGRCTYPRKTSATAHIEWGRPEDGQERKDVDERIEEGEETHGQQRGGQ